MESLPSFALKLRALCAERGWTRYRLAGESGVSQQTLHGVWHGKTEQPRWDTVCKLARAFGLSADVFMESEKRP